MIFLRKLHKWLGLIIGAQMLVWLISGMLISLVDQRTVSGGSTRLPAGERPPLAQFQSLYPVRQLPISTDALQQIKLTSVLGYPVYRVVHQGKPSVFDARTGDDFIVDQALAERIARNSYSGKGELIRSERLDQGSEEMRGVSGAVWQVNFDDALATRAYISAVDGRLLAHRNNRWVFVDFLLMLHFMDYMRIDSFNTPQAPPQGSCNRRASWSK